MTASDSVVKVKLFIYYPIVMWLFAFATKIANLPVDFHIQSQNCDSFCFVMLSPVQVCTMWERMFRFMKALVLNLSFSSHFQSKLARMSKDFKGVLEVRTEVKATLYL